MRQIFSKKQKSFTLIELLIVIAIIQILVSVVLVSLKMAKDKANYAKTQQEIDTVRKAMKMYEVDVGELPPRGDSCPACCYPNCQVEWDRVMNALLNSDGQNWRGPYIGVPISQDAWSHHFYYDDNACNSNCGDSYLGSAGPDGVIGTADDIGVTVTPLSEVQSCCY